MRIKPIKKKEIACLSAVFLFFIMAAASYLRQNVNCLILAGMGIWLGGMVWTCFSLRKRFLMFLFLTAFFTFLFGRPIVEPLIGEDIFEYHLQTYATPRETVFQTLWLCILSLFTVLAGAVLSEVVSFPAHRRKENIGKHLQAPVGTGCRVLERVSLFGYLCAYPFRMILELSKLSFIRQTSYVEYYASFQSPLPPVLDTLASTSNFFFLMFLASLPKKKNTYIVGGLYVLSTIPFLLGGGRIDFVVDVLMLLAYFFFRDYGEGKNSWIGRFEKTAILVALPIGVIGLSAMNFLRGGEGAGDGILSLLLMFFYLQGSTFSKLCVGVQYIDVLRKRRIISYSLGPLVDYFLHNRFAQMFFGAKPLPQTNCMENAVESNMMSHRLSYLVYGEKQYLEGHGSGTSYILELFSDGGYVLLILFSLLLGVILWKAFEWAGKRPARIVILFGMVRGILFLPRGETIGWLEFLWRVLFWLVVLCCMAGTGIILWVNRKYGDRLRKKKAGAFLMKLCGL